MKQDFIKQKSELIDILVKKGIFNKRLLKAIFAVPRELFVPDEMHNLTYKNKELIVTEHIILPSPYVMALMIQVSLPLTKNNILEIGTGTGYQTAVLSLLYKNVYSIEENEILAQRISSKLCRLGYTNTIVCSKDLKNIIRRGMKTVIWNYITNDYDDLLNIIKPDTVLIVQTAEGIMRKILKIYKDQNGKIFKEIVAEIPVERVICF